MGQVYHYTVHGLHVESERPLPELQPVDGVVDGTIDVVISWSTVPAALSGDEVYTGLCYQATKTEFLYDMPLVARYHVQAGRSIAVEPYTGADPASVRLVLFGPIMTALGCQRGLIPLVGSSIVHQGNAVLFIGRAGSGRSTIVSELSRRGYPILSDGVSMVDVSSGSPMLQPAMPRIHLFDDKAHPLERAHPLPPGKEAYTAVRAQHSKYSIAIADRYCQQAAPLTKVIDLSVGGGHEFEILSLDGAKQLGALMEHSFYAHFIRKVYGEAAYFKWCVQIAGRVNVSRLRFTHGDHSVGTVVDLIEKEGLQGR